MAIKSYSRKKAEEKKEQVQQFPFYEPKSFIRGEAIVIASSYRIPKAERKGHLHYYDVRHADDDGFEPVMIQRGVMVNHMATIATLNPLNLGEAGWLDLTEEDGDNILQAI